jgi:hypothetical protein
MQATPPVGGINGDDPLDALHMRAVDQSESKTAKKSAPRAIWGIVDNFRSLKINSCREVDADRKIANLLEVATRGLRDLDGRAGIFKFHAAGSDESDDFCHRSRLYAPL